MHRILTLLVGLVLACGVCRAQSTDVNPARITRSGGVTNDIVRFNGTNWAAWTPPQVSFTAQTTVPFMHNLGRLYVKVTCYAGGAWILPASVVPTSATVSTITFDSAKTGVCAAR